MHKIIFCIISLFTLNSLAATEGVILLHGLCRSNSSMEKMALSLEEAGYLVVNVSYPSREAEIDELSEIAVGDSFNHATLRSCEKIHFVTHSLGGILVRYYFKTHHSQKLGKVVMLGPPNKGSEVVDAIGSWKIFKKLNGPAGNQLGTGLDSIPNTLGSVSFELGIIAGDRSINWINSSMIDGKDDGKVSIENTKIDGMKGHLVIHATHPYLMKNKEAIKQTIQFLQKGEFSR